MSRFFCAYGFQWFRCKPTELNQATTNIGAKITEFKEGFNTKQTELSARLLETEQSQHVKADSVLFTDEEACISADLLKGTPGDTRAYIEHLCPQLEP